MRTKEENKLRRERYAVVMKATGNPKLARKARDHSVKNIAKEFKNIRVKPDTRTIYIYIPRKVVIKKEPVLTKAQKRQLARDKRNAIRRERTKIARELNYTPEEADYLRGVSKKKFEEIISKKTILNKVGRVNRWSKMSKRNKYDPKIVEACENINVEYGYDIDSRFGWAVYYFYYVNGGTIEGWTKYVNQDPFVVHAVSYNQVNQFQF